MRVWLFLHIVIAAMYGSLVCAQPNVVLFFVDDMGWTDWQSSAAHPDGSPVFETPNMLALANSGVTFSNAYASAPVCSPTRASLMTGKSAAKTRVTDWIGAGTSTGTTVRSPANWTKNLPLGEVTLAEALRDGGYDTAFFGKWHLGQNGNPNTTPLVHGYNSNVGGTFSGNPGFAGGFFAGADGAWAGMPGLDTPGTYSSNEYLSDVLAEKATDYITQSQQVANPDPFFLTMSHYLVHTPLQAPQSLINKYTNKISTLQGQGTDLKGHDNATYAAMVEKMDQSLGMILNRLEDPNNDGNTIDSIRDDTIILFTSDHGGLDTSTSSPTDNAPLREGKGSLYEGGTRVPYLMSWTGNANVAQGSTSSARTATHDIYPTLLDLTGVAGNATQNAAIDGVSIRSALEGQTFDRGRLFWHYPHISPQDSGSDEVNGGTFVSSVVEGDWKLVYFYDVPHYELYNLASDPSETRSVLLANPHVANSLSSALRDYLVDINAQMPVSIDTGNPVDTPPVLQLNVQPPTLKDEFGYDHNFKTLGAAGTAWDGAMNANAASQFAASAASGTLQTASNARFVAGAFDAPLLHKTIVGDFEAVMEIGEMDSLNFNVAAIVAGDPTDLAQDFLWVGQQDRSNTNSDFAQSRNIDDGSRSDEQNLAGTYRYFRLARDGDLFTGSVSNDGALWTEYASYNRPDLPTELLIGITQGTFSASVGSVEIESFSIDLALPGDFNGDGNVDGADLSAWQTNVGMSSGARQSDGDADLDGDVDGSDFLLWQRSRLLAQPTTSQVVPEPLGSSLMVTSAICFTIRSLFRI